MISCYQSNVINGVDARLTRPRNSIRIECEDAFSGHFSEVLNCVAIQIVNDTILVIQGGGEEEMFKAYSTKSFSCLGTFMSRGRGPGEMLSPHIVKSLGENKSLCINDNSLRQAVFADVLGSISEKKLVPFHMFELPHTSLDWIPIGSSGQFNMCIEDNEIIEHVCDNKGEVQKKLQIFHDYPADKYATKLSSILTSNGENGMIAEFMICLPQINLINAVSGEIKVVVVDKCHKNWKQILDEPFSLNSLQFYAGATCSQDYLFASYWNEPLGETMNGEHGASIHIFDWEGKFLYDLKVREDISDMAFDDNTKYLYCIERTKDRIVRYDLSGLI